MSKTDTSEIAVRKPTLLREKRQPQKLFFNSFELGKPSHGLGFVLLDGMLLVTVFFWIKSRQNGSLRAFAALGLAMITGMSSASAVSSQNRVPAALRSAEALTAPSKILYRGETTISPDLIANYEAVKSTQKDLDPSKYIPLNMKPTDDSSAVMNVIADRSVSQFFNDPAVRASALGRTATKVEKNLKQEVVLGGASNDPEKIEHKINFQILAFQTRAEMKYEGITNALVSYEARNSTTTFEVFEKLPTKKHQQVVLSHELRPDERVSNLSLRWNW